MRNRSYLYLGCALLCALPSLAAVQSIHVLERSDVAGGHSFGAAGPYERIRAKVNFAVDPTKPANAIVADIALAPRNAQGLVEFASDLYVLKPTDPSKGNGTILFDVSNRGGKGLLSMFSWAAASRDPRAMSDFGDGSLLAQGYTLVWLGWQFDVAEEADLLRLYAPVATNNGAPITGLVRGEFIAETAGVQSFPLGSRNMLGYPVAAGTEESAQLTVRDLCTSARRPVPRDQWRFARLDNGKETPDATQVYLPAGLEPGKLYEVIYTSKDPVVAGLGMAAVRDFMSYLKYGGQAASLNVLGDQRRFLKRAVGFGSSQSGRWLRNFLYDGFNADEAGKQVFDGVWAHVAGGGRGSFNHRFAQPSRDGQPLGNCLYPVDMFPFSDETQSEGEMLSGGLLAKATAAKVVPKIFYTNSSYEYWGRVASLIHTSPDGRRDTGLGAQSRAYFMTGTSHGAGSFPPPRGPALNQSNGNNYRWIMRGLLARMNAWVTSGAEPPATQTPLVAKDSLVAVGALHWPKIPGTRLPQHPKLAYRGDFYVVPPRVGPAFPTLLPQVDADGNETTGIRAPMMQAPLATYTGWNLRKPSQGSPDELYSMVGSTFLFPKTKAARAKAKDPRPSIEERYKGRADYLARYEAAARELAASGYLLESDVAALVGEGAKQWDTVMGKAVMGK